MQSLFGIAYTLSGLAGLVYEVAWTRLLTLYIGHTTAAASAVVAAFLGGLAAGAALGGRVAMRLAPRQSLQAYAGLELGVAAAALLLPLELQALRPLLEWAYADGATGPLFPAIRLLSCLLMVFVPAVMLGATFPLAVRWFTTSSRNPAASGGTLYFLNTAGATAGALLGGFVLIPVAGISGTTWIGVAGSTLAAAMVLAILKLALTPRSSVDQAGKSPRQRTSRTSRASRAERNLSHPSPPVAPDAPVPWLPVVILGITGFASLMHEIAWTRILALVLGPTIYAFSAALAAVIGGVAIGSGLGAWAVRRVARPAVWLAFALAGAALTASWTFALAGSHIPGAVARQLAASSNGIAELLQQNVVMPATLILPTAACLGAAFPLALAVVADPSKPVAGRFGLVYAVNTIGAVSGSLAAGFLFIPLIGLRATLTIVSLCLIAASLIVVIWGTQSRRSRGAGLLAAFAASAMLVFSPPWDRELLASGAYLYAPYVPGDLDLEALLRAGTLLYYREGASATVTVKRLTGTTTLAVDGKTDASNRGDMLTQKLVAHLPLLLHDRPQEVAIIGLGSGVTLGAALRHPIARADVIEISPEVVEASRFFDAENHRALDDRRTRLIVGDGRSHLLLARRTYDVIISEPSNPWIAGVAALFTREFFAAARERLAPGGVICQWANAYNISERDLRSIVATFQSVFPDGTAWLVGEDDVVLVAAREGPIEARLEKIARHWARPGVADDLATVGAIEPFSILSLFVAGPGELARYSQGAPILDDDTMTLEFSGPRELHNRRAGENGATLTALLGSDGGPPVIRQARASAGAAQWRHRAIMMGKRDAHAIAYDDYVRALQIDITDAAALEGFVRTAVLLRRGSDALSWIKTLAEPRPVTVDILLARSKLLASIDAPADAVDAARQAAKLAAGDARPLEQLASLFADAGDTVQLDAAVADLRRLAPDRPATHYYAAVAALLHGRPEDAVTLAQQAVAADPQYAPVYDLLGAAYTKLARPVDARQAFEKSLSFDAHDSTAYTNLGLLELAAGNHAAAARYFAEALWLVPDSQTARAGLAQARAAN